MPTAHSTQTVAAKVRSVAAEKRISIKRLAGISGIEYSALLRRTRGDVEFTATDLVVVAEALGVPVASLLPATVDAVAS